MRLFSGIRFKRLVLETGLGVVVRVVVRVWVRIRVRFLRDSPFVIQLKSLYL
jgi:hypothetical protein